MLNQDAAKILRGAFDQKKKEKRDREHCPHIVKMVRDE